MITTKSIAQVVTAENYVPVDSGKKQNHNPLNAQSSDPTLPLHHYHQIKY